MLKGLCEGPGGAFDDGSLTRVHRLEAPASVRGVGDERFFPANSPRVELHDACGAQATHGRRIQVALPKSDRGKQEWIQVEAISGCEEQLGERVNPGFAGNLGSSAVSGQHAAPVVACPYGQATKEGCR